MSNFKLILTIIVLCSLQFTCVYASEFLENGSGARTEALGRAATALGDDLDAYYFNPAGYASQKHAKINTMYSKELDQFNVYYLGYGGKLFNGYGAVNLYMARLDDIPETSYVNGEIVDSGKTFEYSSKALFLSYGAKVDDHWSMGLNLKYLSEILYENQASGIGLDIGGTYSLRDIRFGLMAVNVLQPVMIWDTDSGHQDLVARKYNFGLAYLGLEQFVLSADLSFEPHYVFLRYGVEYNLNRYLALRAGFASDAYTFGLGLKYAQAHFDYAFVKSTETVIDDTHRFSMGYIFGTEDERQVSTGKALPEKVQPKEQVGKKVAAEVAVTAPPQVTADTTQPGPPTTTLNAANELVLGKKSVVVADGKIKCSYNISNPGTVPVTVRAVVNVRNASGEKITESAPQNFTVYPREEYLYAYAFSNALFSAGSYTIEARFEAPGAEPLLTSDQAVVQ